MRDETCMLTRNESENNYQYTLTVTIPINHIHSEKKNKLENWKNVLFIAISIFFKFGGFQKNYFTMFSMYTSNACKLK